MILEELGSCSGLIDQAKGLLVYAYNQWELLGGSKGTAKLHFLAKLHF